jgi:indolepyruvate decarboxylase
VFAYRPTALHNPVLPAQTPSVPTPINSPTAFNSTAVIALLEQLLCAQSATVPVVSDIGDCLFASLALTASTLLAPAYYASMGYAVPAAIGVQAASGLRPLVLVGDGAFQMTGLELGHCARYGFAPIVVLLNNKSWQMISAFSPQLASTSLSGWNYTTIAQGMGGVAQQVSNLAELSAALTAALQEHDRFSLIEVLLPDGGCSDRLQQFAAGFLAAQASAQSQVLPVPGCCLV